MSVVIHDFEVVPKQDAEKSASAPSRDAPQAQQLSPRDVVHIDRHRKARALRVWAH